MRRAKEVRWAGEHHWEAGMQGGARTRWMERWGRSQMMLGREWMVRGHQGMEGNC